MTLEIDVVQVPTDAGLAPYAGRAEPAVSWAAIFAGATVALGASLILTVLAAGFGLKLAFPGIASPGSLAAFTPMLGAWAIAVQVVSAALGGYLAGRLRTNWLGVHGDEAHFRDTAHGLIVWALSTVAGVVLAVTVLAPYAAQLALPTLAGSPALMSVADVERAENIAAQSSLFIAIGMLLSAFVAAVAARLGGHRTEEMHLKART